MFCLYLRQKRIWALIFKYSNEPGCFTRYYIFKLFSTKAKGYIVTGKGQNMKPRVLLLYFFICVAITATAQQSNRTVQQRCGTMQLLESRFERNPALRVNFENQRTRFNNAVREGAYKLSSRSGNGEGSANRTAYTIPVVFHIVSKTPNGITDAAILAQLDTLNKNFSGTNADSVKIPSYFKPLFGKTTIQFCLAQRTPGGANTTGIERITTTQSSFTSNDAIKHAASGGANIWSSDKYLNIWVGTLSNNLLGYSTFPDDGQPLEQGVVMDYRTLPGGTFAGYNSGKTLTHEVGHYFNLYHIWGDDDGACSGTDYVGDTPNQYDASSSCYSGIKTDSCTKGGNGIMYQNYLDYSTDACMVMFTVQQVSRMESALLAYRSSLLSSNGCLAPFTRNYDAQLRSVNQPVQRICSSSFTPAVTIQNLGAQTLTSLVISSKIDNGSISTYNWKGSLSKLASTDVNLNSLTTTAGNHILTVYITNPNSNPDEDVTNDTFSIAYQYYVPVETVSESFETTSFVPAAWDIVNPDNSISWKRVTGYAKTGNASVVVNNYDYTNKGEKDDLRLPEVTLTGMDSAFLSFQVAAAAYTTLSSGDNEWDTLEVLISTDCGQNYTTLYKKFGSNLVTRISSTTNEFRPAANEWRKDSVDLTNYIGTNNVLLAFRNTNGYENNIYLDDINVRTVKINPNLKSQGFLVTPNPTRGVITVQFYPQPANLRGVQVYNTAGQKIAEVLTNGQANNLYSINIANQPAGMYIVRAVFTDRVITKKILKQ